MPILEPFAPGAALEGESFSLTLVFSGAEAIVELPFVGVLPPPLVAYTCSTVRPQRPLIKPSAQRLNSTMGGRSAGMVSVAQTSAWTMRLTGIPKMSTATWIAAKLSFP